MNEKKQSNEHIQVFVRCRPLSKSELKFPIPVEVHPDVNKILIRDSGTDKQTVKSFTFDRVFGPDAKQADIYDSVVAPLIQEVITGFNCTIFAYGQTGTGKTFTIEGGRTGNLEGISEDPSCGIIPRSMKHLIGELTEQGEGFEIRVSFLELYNEEIFDLLSKDNNPAKLKIFDNSLQKGSVIVQGLELKPVTSMEEVYSILDAGFKKRRKAATLLNKASSRSHTVFTVTVVLKESSVSRMLTKTGKLNLVDLAGSENVGRSGASDKRAREAGNINQSLLALGRVITSLCEKAAHIPYRESKLTRLLQDSLGGQTKTAVIATISPSAIHVDETLNTLEYALRAKNIANKPEVNAEVTMTSLSQDYLEEISRLTRKIYEFGENDCFYVPEEYIKHMESTLASKREEKFQALYRVTNLEEENKMLDRTIEEANNNLAEEKKRLEDAKLRYKEYCQTLEREKEENKLHEAMLQVMQPLRDHLHDKLHEDIEKKRSLESELLKEKEKLKSATEEQLYLREKLKINRKNRSQGKEKLHDSAEKLFKNIKDSHDNINSLASECKNYVALLKNSFDSVSMLFESKFTNLHRAVSDLKANYKSFEGDTVSSLNEENAARLKWSDEVYDTYQSFSEYEVLEPLNNILKECENSFLRISSAVNRWKNLISSEANMRQNSIQELFNNQNTAVKDLTDSVSALLKKQNESLKEYCDIITECVNFQATSKALFNDKFHAVDLAMSSLDLFFTEHTRSKCDKTSQGRIFLKNSTNLVCKINENLNLYCEKSAKDIDEAYKEMNVYEFNAFSREWDKMKKSVDVSHMKCTELNMELAKLSSYPQDVDGISNGVEDTLKNKFSLENNSISSCIQEMINSILKCGDSYKTSLLENQTEIDKLLPKDSTHLEKLSESSKLLLNSFITKVPDYMRYIETEMKTILKKESTGENENRTEGNENEISDADITITSAEGSEGAPERTGCECPVCDKKISDETLYNDENGSHETAIAQCSKNLLKSPVKEMKVQSEASESRSFMSRFQLSPVRRPSSRPALSARRHLKFLDFEKLAHQVLQSSSDEDLYNK